MHTANGRQFCISEVYFNDRRDNNKAKKELRRVVQGFCNAQYLPMARVPNSFFADGYSIRSNGRFSVRRQTNSRYRQLAPVFSVSCGFTAQASKRRVAVLDMVGRRRRKLFFADVVLPCKSGELPDDVYPCRRAQRILDVLGMLKNWSCRLVHGAVFEERI